MSKERPILFSGPMVCAILAGQKTQTRRVIKPLPCEWELQKNIVGTYQLLVDRCKHGLVGDQLWVRETCSINHVNHHVHYMADHQQKIAPITPSIFMPRWASRITLEITDVRVQRLQDISEDDAKAEGVSPVVFHGYGEQKDAHKISFEILWNQINEKRGYGWDVNPFVWAISFRVAK